METVAEEDATWQQTTSLRGVRAVREVPREVINSKGRGMKGLKTTRKGTGVRWKRWMWTRQSVM
jgi:hypothetical protein